MKAIKEQSSLKTYLLVTFSICLIFSACTPAPLFIKSDYSEKQIKSFAVLPLADKRESFSDSLSTDDTIKELEQLITEEILDKDYDVLTPMSIRNILKDKSIPKNRVKDIPISDLCSLLKVDCVLYSNLNYHNDVYFIDHSLTMDFKLFNSIGDSLWTNNIDASNKPILYALGYGLGAGLGSSGYGGNESKGALIAAGIVGALLGVAVADGIVNEISGFIEQCLYSLPDGKGSGVEIER